jgi:hypothetical protein
MRNRLIMGALRYGLIHAPGKPKYDRIGSITRRLEKYKQDGNLEHLVDAANLCLMEFEEGTHPLKHFGAQDDGEHAQVIHVKFVRKDIMSSGRKLKVLDKLRFAADT